MNPSTAEAIKRLTPQQLRQVLAVIQLERCLRAQAQEGK